MSSNVEPAPVSGPIAWAEAFEFAKDQIQALIARAPGRTPAYTRDGRWVLDDDPWAPSWTGGFLAGMMWVFAARSGDPTWREQAEAHTLALGSRKDDPGTHDLGFILEPSFGRWFDIDQNLTARSALIAGGRTMASRRQPGGYLSTWVDPGSTFIDVMMNVGIIFRAAELAKDQQLYEIALLHTRTSMRFLMRGDGSTAHEGWFDTTTGEFLRAATHQGSRADSTWARGQAWAIYGFTAAFEHTRQYDVLDAAMRAADYYLRKVPKGGIPPNDLADERGNQPKEASAGAIAAAGLLRLADALRGAPIAQLYRRSGLEIVDSLCSPDYLAIDTPGWEGILRHAIYHQRNGLGVDESVMWGEYYFVEALDHALRLDSAGPRHP